MNEGQEPRERLLAMRIAQLITEYPQSRAVLFSHFGASCFDCPASQEETIALGVRVHSADMETFYNDLLKKIAIPAAQGVEGQSEPDLQDKVG